MRRRGDGEDCSNILGEDPPVFQNPHADGDIQNGHDGDEKIGRFLYLPELQQAGQQRSQHQNREVAMTMLKSKLIEIKEREHLAKIEDIKGDHKEIAWGSQIRSYVFMPYTLAKDHRTSFENGNINAVMDGDLDGFINAYLKMQSQKNLENN